MAPPLLALKNARLRIGQQQLFAGLDAMLAQAATGSASSAATARASRRCCASWPGSIELDSGELLHAAASDRRLSAAGAAAARGRDPGRASSWAACRRPSAAMPPATAPRSCWTSWAWTPVAGAGGPLRRRDPPRLAGPGAGGRARRAAPGRAHQPSRPADDRVARGAARGLSRLVRRDQPRSPLPDPSLDPDLVARPRHAAQQRPAAMPDSRTGASRSWPPRKRRSRAWTSGWRPRRTGCTAGVTARRKRNMGRLRQLHDLRAQRRQIIAPQGSRPAARRRAGAVSGRLVIEARRSASASPGGRSCRASRPASCAATGSGIIGPNGAGKTTLLKLLTGELAPDTGTVRLGTNLEIARFDQHRAQLDPNRTPWEILCPHGGDRWRCRASRATSWAICATSCSATSRRASRSRALSGGERNRLLLAKILAQPSNLLILDEPTNDLDIDTLDLLEEMLADYRGHAAAGQPRPRLPRPAGDLDHRVRRCAAAGANMPAATATGCASARPRSRPPRRRARAAHGTGAGTRARIRREAAARAGPAAGTDGHARGEIATIEERLADPGSTPAIRTHSPAPRDELERCAARLAALEERWLELETQREAEAAAGFATAPGHSRPSQIRDRRDLAWRYSTCSDSRKPEG